VGGSLGRSVRLWPDDRATQSLSNPASLVDAPPLFRQLVERGEPQPDAGRRVRGKEPPAHHDVAGKQHAVYSRTEVSLETYPTKTLRHRDNLLALFRRQRLVCGWVLGAGDHEDFDRGAACFHFRPSCSRNAVKGEPPRPASGCRSLALAGSGLHSRSRSNSRRAEPRTEVTIQVCFFKRVDRHVARLPAPSLAAVKSGWWLVGGGWWLVRLKRDTTTEQPADA
jgi:hypothetical protein